MSITDWRDMFPHTVTHAGLSSRNDYGAPAYGTPVSYTARVVYKSQLVRKADGQETVARGVVWLLSADDVNVEDQITLPDSSTPTILAVDRTADEAGTHHTKIYFQ